MKTSFLLVRIIFLRLFYGLIYVHFYFAKCILKLQYHVRPPKQNTFYLSFALIFIFLCPTLRLNWVTNLYVPREIDFIPR